MEASENEFQNEQSDDKKQDGEGNDEADGDNEHSHDQNYHFYKEYCRLYYANIILTNRLQQLLNEKQDLGYKLNRLEVSVVLLSNFSLFFICQLVEQEEA